MQRVHVFIDESGDEHSNVDTGASEYYVLAAICVREEDLSELEAQAEALRKKYFQSGEMKSSGIAGNLQRRLTVLNAISALPFFGYVKVVVKRRLNPDSGLRFPQPFLKFVAKQLCIQLRVAESVHVIFDRKGRAKFRAEFKRYLEAAFPTDDFFKVMTFEDRDSKACVPIQAADVIAGTTAKCYQLPSSEQKNRLMRDLGRCSTICAWPRRIEWGRYPSESAATEFDVIVGREAMSRAWGYIENPGQGEPEDLALRCKFLHLLMNFAESNDGEFMPTPQIRQRLAEISGEGLDSQALGARVVGPLRDAGLLISSSTKGGYKLPASVDDMRRYVELCSSQIPPGLGRLRRARDTLLTQSVGRLDILSGSGHEEIRAALKGIEQMSLEATEMP
jgi:hypothetical protein